MDRTVKVIPVIYQTLETRGSGKDGSSPVRALRRVHDLNGSLIAESDPFSYTIEHIHSVAFKMFGEGAADNFILNLK